MILNTTARIAIANTIRPLLKMEPIPIKAQSKLKTYFLMDGKVSSKKPSTGNWMTLKAYSIGEAKGLASLRA